MSSNLARRITVAAVAIPAALGIVYLGGWVLALTVAVLAVVGTHELFGLARRAGVRPLAVPGYAGAAIIPLLGFATLPEGLALSGMIAVGSGAVWLMAIMAVAMLGRAPTQQPLAAVAVTVFGPLYTGGLPAFLLLLRHGEPSPSAWAATWLVFLPLVVTWISDSLAMAGGSMIGGPKLAPVLSPNKTWAGAVSGGAGSLIVAPLYGALILGPLGVAMPLWQLVVFGGLVSVVGQVGDVAESLFKREAGVKDSGSFFPGHGGVLDRLDSLYWVIPSAALMLLGFGAL